MTMKISVFFCEIFNFFITIMPILIYKNHITIFCSETWCEMIFDTDAHIFYG
jgi:hypothetical protein